MAEEVDDPALTADALAAPGTVIRRARGSLAEQLDAAGEPPQGPPDDKPGHAAGYAKAAPRKSHTRKRDTPKPPPRKAKPKPSRANLEDAEAALARAEADAEANRTEMRREAEALRKRHQASERDDNAFVDKLTAAKDAARRAYEAAMTEWRADD